mgnify:CR=1 FL=1
MTAPQPYPEYRDSGIAWLGDIPAHWKRAHGGAVLQPKMVSNRGMVETTVLSLSYGRIVIKPPEKLHGLVPESFETYQVVDPGDIIVRPTDLQNDWNTIRVALAQDRGIITSAYLCFRTREPLTAEFAHLLLLGYDLKKVFYGMGSGLRQNLDWSDFKRLPILLPPPDEQQAIVRFVRDLDKKVNRFIRNRRRLIEVLNEQKQAIINRAVTRGLDPNAPLKPSGIDWLGDIPEHWEVVKLKRVARINPSRSEAFELRDSNDPVVFLPMERVSVDGQVDQSERRSVREVWQGFTYFRRGDVVVAKITPCFENGKGACLTGLDTEIGFGTTEFIVLRPSEAVSAEFLYQLTMLAEFRLLGVESMTGAAGQQRVSPDFVANFGVPVPPKHEQDRIVAYVEQKAAKFRALIDRARHEIDLIREYRTRLIADVVTGKVDVRGLALAEPPLDDEQIDEGIDDEEMLGDDEPELVEEAADADD